MRLRPPPALRAAALALAACVVLPALLEAIYVSPTAVFMDDRARDAQIVIGNSGDRAEEATIELQFGFPDADSTGTPFIRLIDDPGPEFPSAAAWIRAFPQRVQLDPGSQQVVRLLARPPADLPDGEYWSRLIITGRGTVLQVPSVDTAVRVGLNLQTRLVTSVSYRKGRVTTGVTLRQLTAEVDADSLTVWASMAREGNAAYHGTAEIELTRLNGEAMRTWSAPLSVHYPVRRRFAFRLDSVAPGDYRVRFQLRTRRPDLPSDRLLPAPTVRDSVPVRIG